MRPLPSWSLATRLFEKEKTVMASRGNRLLAVLVVFLGAGIARAADEGPSILSVRRETGPRSDLSTRPRSRSNTVGLYEKLELHVDLKATYANPYDPEQVDLWAEFTSPSGKPWRIWGFYNPSNWSSLWMVRFAPTEVGTWHYVVKVRDGQGAARAAAGHLKRWHRSIAGS